MEITVDDCDRQFIVRTGESVFYFDFDEIFVKARELLARVTNYVHMRGSLVQAELMTLYAHMTPVKATEVGTKNQFEQYSALMRMYHQTRDTATWYDERTPAAVRQVLERYRGTGRKVRLFLGSPETGKDWMEEYGVVGSIDRSTGPMRIPTLLESRSNCGGVILTHCIVRIKDADSNVELYRHPQYHQSELRLAAADSSDQAAGYLFAAERLTSFDSWEGVALFKTEIAAKRWLSFMRGETSRH